MSSVAANLFNNIYKIIGHNPSDSLDRKSRKRPAEEVPQLQRKYRRVSDFSKSYPAVLFEEPRRTYVIPVDKPFGSRFSGVFGMSKYSKSKKIEPDYADLEYSDDDENEVIFVTEKLTEQEHQNLRRNNTSVGAKQKNHYLNDEEIENHSNQKRPNSPSRRLVTKSPPFLTRGALMLSRVPGLHPIDRSRFKSSNTFRNTTNPNSILHNGNSAEGILKWGSSNLFETKNSNSSHNKSNNNNTAATMAIATSSGKSPLIKTNLNSIVSKTMNLEERHKYFDLLKSCAPDVYKNDWDFTDPGLVQTLTLLDGVYNRWMLLQKATVIREENARKFAAALPPRPPPRHRRTLADNSSVRTPRSVLNGTFVAGSNQNESLSDIDIARNETSHRFVDISGSDINTSYQNPEENPLNLARIDSDFMDLTGYRNRVPEGILVDITENEPAPPQLKTSNFPWFNEIQVDHTTFSSIAVIANQTSSRQNDATTVDPIEILNEIVFEFGSNSNITITNDNNRRIIEPDDSSDEVEIISDSNVHRKIPSPRRKTQTREHIPLCGPSQPPSQAPHRNRQPLHKATIPRAIPEPVQPPPAPRKESRPPPRSKSSPPPQRQKIPSPSRKPVSAPNQNNQAAAGQSSRPAAGQISRPAAGQISRPAAGQISRPAAGQISRPAAGQISRPAAVPSSRPAAGQISRPAAGQNIIPSTSRNVAAAPSRNIPSIKINVPSTSSNVPSSIKIVAGTSRTVAAAPSRNVAAAPSRNIPSTRSNIPSTSRNIPSSSRNPPIVIVPDNKTIISVRPTAQVAPKPVVRNNRQPVQDPNVSIEIIEDDDSDDVVIVSSPTSTRRTGANRPPDVTPVNSLRNKFQLRAEFQDGWLANVSKKYSSKEQQRLEDIIQQTESLHDLTSRTRRNELELQKRLQEVRIAPEIIQIDDSEEEREKIEFPPLSKDDERFICRVTSGGEQEEVIIEKFNLRITRYDLSTLLGLTWLNDEVINFYMNLLMERGSQQCYPSVYAMNTFFIPRLLQSGHCGVRRWTRKVDIFSYDYIPIPVHIGHVHWCMAIINNREKTIKYYDSMNTPNPVVLRALENYLKDESMDKKNLPLNISEWKSENVKDIPLQKNGCDCGVFSCTYAEYITRNKPITFTQAHMPYLRKKMIVEIAKGKLFFN